MDVCNECGVEGSSDVVILECNSCGVVLCVECADYDESIGPPIEFICNDCLENN